MTVPEIQKLPYFNGESRHFTHFGPYFAVNQGKSSVKIPPYYYPFKDIFSILYPISREVKDIFSILNLYLISREVKDKILRE